MSLSLKGCSVVSLSSFPQHRPLCLPIGSHRYTSLPASTPLARLQGNRAEARARGWEGVCRRCGHVRMERRCPPPTAALDPGEPAVRPGPGSRRANGDVAVPVRGLDGPRRAAMSQLRGPGGGSPSSACSSLWPQQLGRCPRTLGRAGSSALRPRCQSPQKLETHQKRWPSCSLSRAGWQAICQRAPQAKAPSAALPLPVPQERHFWAHAPAVADVLVTLQKCKHLRAKFLDGKCRVKGCVYW